MPIPESRPTRPGQSAFAFQTFIALKTQSTKAHYSVAVAWLVLGNFIAARNALERGLLLELNFPGGPSHLAVVYEQFEIA